MYLVRPADPARRDMRLPLLMPIPVSSVTHPAGWASHGRAIALRNARGVVPGRYPSFAVLKDHSDGDRDSGEPSRYASTDICKKPMESGGTSSVLDDAP